MSSNRLGESYVSIRLHVEVMQEQVRPCSKPWKKMVGVIGCAMDYKQSDMWPLLCARIQSELKKKNPNLLFDAVLVVRRMARSESDSVVTLTAENFECETQTGDLWEIENVCVPAHSVASCTVL